MSAPRVKIENYEEVYDYYRQREPSPFVARLGHLVAGLLYHPNVDYQSGAQAKIHEKITGDSKRPVLIVPNHINRSDVMHLPAILQREKVFRPMRTKTVIVAKSPLFRDARRIIYDRLGAIPAFRKKDSEGLDLDYNHKKFLQASAKKELSDVIGSKIDSGFNVAIFSEGELSRHTEEADPRTVQPLRDGIIDMINAANDPEGLMIITAGFAYTGVSSAELRKPRVYIPEPLEIGNSTDGLLNKIQSSLQSAVDVAHEGIRI